MTVALHWGTVLCIVIAVAAAILREFVGDPFWRLLLLEIHLQLGLMVLLGVAVRLALRLRYGMADHMIGEPRLMRLAAGGSHLSLYALLIGLPLLGWATTNAHDLGMRFLGLLPLPALVEVDAELADTLSENHVLGSWLLLGLVALHASAALYHHFVRGDRVLWAMLPSRADAVSPRAAKPARDTGGLLGR